MKTKFFSPRLYWEKMRQLRTVGFVSMVLCSLLLLLYMLKFLPSQDKYSSLTLVGDLAYYTEPLQFSLLRYLPVIILLTVALITCTALRFNNKRSDSDFYHALPHTRTCQFCSSFAAAQSWILLVMLAMLATALCCAQAVPDAALVKEGLSSLFFGVWAACFGVGCTVSLGMAMSGQSGVGIFLSFALLIGPRWLLNTFSGAAVLRYLFLTDQSFSFSSHLHLGNAFLFDSTVDPYLEWQNGVYTLVLGVAAFALALWIFAKRKSETAGQAAPSRILQAVFRIAVSSLPLLLLLCSSFSNIKVTTLSFILAVAGSLLLFFLYELFSTKNVKNLVRIIPQLGLLLCVCLVAYGGLQVVDYAYKSFAPSMQQIQSVQIHGNHTPGGVDIPTENEWIRGIVAHRLKFTIDCNLSQLRGMDSLEVTIHTEDTSARRRIYLSHEEETKLLDILKKEPAYHKAYASLPDLDMMTGWWIELPGEKLQLHKTKFSDQLYLSLREELKTVDATQWYNRMKEKYKPTEPDRVLVMAGFKEPHFDHDCFSLRYLLIDRQLTPNTYRMYLQERWEAERQERSKLVLELTSNPTSVLLVYKPGFLSVPQRVPVNSPDAAAWMDAVVQAHQSDTLDLSADYYPYFIGLKSSNYSEENVFLFVLPQPMP